MDSHAKVARNRSVLQFEKSSAQNFTSPKHRLDELLSAASQTTADANGLHQHYCPELEPKPNYGGDGESDEPSSKRPKRHYEEPFSHPYLQTGSQQVEQLVHKNSPSQTPATGDPHIHATTNTDSKTASRRTFRYMYLTDDASSGPNATTTAKYTGRLISQDLQEKLPSSETGVHEPKTYRCIHADCGRAFSRPSDLRRHAKSHQAPAFHCPYYANDPSCHRNGGSFARSDVLKRHLRLMHYVRDKQMLYPGPEPGWCRSCQKMFESTKSFLEHCTKCAASSRPSVWKGLNTNKEVGI